MTGKQFTLETRDCYNYGIWVVDIIKDNGIELPQSTVCDLLNKLTEENEELNSIKKFADRNGICIFNIDEAFRRCWQDNAKLVKENEELKKEVTHWKKILDNHQQIVAKTLREQYHWLKNEDKIQNNDKTVALLELEAISARLGIDLN